MPLFNINSKKKKSPQPTRYAAPGRSEEVLPRPAFAPSADRSTSSIDEAYSDRRIPDYRFTQNPAPAPAPNPNPNLTQPPEPSPSLHRSQSQRQPQPQRDRPTPRRLKKNLFVRASSGLLERSVSVKGKNISHPISQPTSPQFPALNEDRIHPAYSEGPSPNTPHEPRSASLAYQQQHLQHPQPLSQENTEWSQQPLQTQQHPAPLPLGRSSTDLSLLDRSNRPSPTEPLSESPRYPPEQSHRGQSHSRTQQDLGLSARPPSRQTHEPLSPARPNQPEVMQQSQQQQVQAQAQPAQNDRSSGQDSSRRGSTTQPVPAVEGQNTPTPNRVREDPENIDVRALLQKHEELQSKYSKVKRYYFDKEAQVQHLQNTVAHQRMAVSRTVLDDNEYANRFQRLDGAIKDLAFSVRKDWRGVPTWLRGLVTDEAVSTGTKEMTSVGRAVISRWLAEELFHKYFHPGLETGLSLQLKSIEMNLRRQQMRPATDEDRENAIARLSNWRRTTFDGLGDMLADAAAQEHRAELIEHLSVELASFLSSQVHEAALPGLEAGVRMIIENSVNIAEKIPLEARDVCIEYFPSNVTFVEVYMKVEGQLPPLSRQPPPPADQEPEDATGVESDSSPASISTGGGDGTSAAPRESKTKSVFGAIMGRKGNEPRPTAGHVPEEKSEPVEGPARIRFSSFLTVEVRGKGPSMVLVKAPVWMIE
ncbi:hypothetical protein N7526_007389 [Penicillium atrosanguineum]|nr:hypothetical protein N7526_007389 [Penicillium atrosanguineum]